VAAAAVAAVVTLLAARQGAAVTHASGRLTAVPASLTSPTPPAAAAAAAAAATTACVMQRTDRGCQRTGAGRRRRGVTLPRTAAERLRTGVGGQSSAGAADAGCSAPQHEPWCCAAIQRSHTADTSARACYGVGQIFQCGCGRTHILLHLPMWQAV
jgi:hypothetical protein